MDSTKAFYHSNTSPQENSAFPFVLPMKAALHFDGAVGFGEWRLLLSTRAIQDLREARRTNKGAFKIIVKKLKSVVFSGRVVL
jgi:hypothetical protein